MAIDIGRLNKRVTLLHYIPKQDKDYSTTQSLSPYKTVWASIDPTKGREYFEAQRIRSELTYKIFIRYLNGVNENMLIKFKDRTFEMVSPPINAGEENELLLLICIEKRG